MEIKWWILNSKDGKQGKFQYFNRGFEPQIKYSNLNIEIKLWNLDSKDGKQGKFQYFNRGFEAQIKYSKFHPTKIP